MKDKKITAIILAGGKGTRLKPYTTFVPKPLMPIGDMPIIEVVLNQIKDAGITKVILAVGHMAQLIQAFVGNGERFGLEIEYSFENEPLGTAGPFGLLKSKLKESDIFISLNGDVLTTLKIKEAVEFHVKQGAMATICVNKRQVAIDFGVINSTAEGKLESYTEKPTIHYQVSMGINVFDSKTLDYVEPGKFLNIPDLMLKLKDAGEPVFCFQKDAYWLDIGRVDDYQTACEIFEQRKHEFLPDGK